MTAKEKEVAEEYSNALADLNINSKPLINMLTMLADENSPYAPIIVQCIERQLHKVQADSKLPVLYLIDSIIKNVGQPYVPLFVQNIEKLFTSTFIKVDEKTRANMYKLRSTWNDVIAPTKLHALDVTINAIDKNWPISSAPPNIHVNPKFLNNVNHTEIQKPTPTKEVDDASLREQFILFEKQKEYLELQQKKLELELLHTRNQIEMRKKRNMLKNTSNVSTSSPSTNISSNDNTKIQALPENTRRNAEDSNKIINIPTISSESPSMPTKVIASPSKKFQSTPIPAVQQPSKNPQPHHSQMAISNPMLNLNQQIPKINPVSTQLLQTLNRDPRLRKVESPVKLSSTSSDNVKQLTFKNKEEKKLRRESNKHRDSKRKEKSPIHSPSKRDLSRKSVKKADRKEKYLKDEKYHKRRDDKKTKDPEIKKKNISSNAKMQQNDIVMITHETSFKEEKLLNEQVKDDNNGMDLSFIKPIENIVSDEKHVSTETPNETEVNVFTNTSDFANTDSTLEDSDSLKRLRIYMQTMKKSPEPSSSPDPELTNDSIGAVKTNQNIIITPQNDIDLRIIAPAVKRPSDSIKVDDIEPAAKKCKSETVDELFGAEDVDLRTLTAPPITTTTPTPPPPPQISETPIPEVGKSWAKYKEMKPDTFKTPYKSPSKKIQSELKETIIDNDSMDVDMRAKPTQNNKSHILRQAEEALNTGSITFDEYTKIMRQVIEMTEVEKLAEESTNESMKLKEYTIPKIAQTVNGNGTDLQNKPENVASIEKPIAENSGIGPWNKYNKKPSDISGSDDSDSSSRSGSTGSEESKRINKKSDSEDRPMFKRRKTFKHNDKDNSKSRSWRNNKSWIPRPENGSRFSHNRNEPWSRGPRPNYSHSTRSLVPPPRYEVPRPTAPFAPSSPDWTVPVIPPSDPVILDMIAHDTTKTISIDGVSREIRFYGPTAITFTSWDDPREIYFQGLPKNVIFDDLFSVLCHFNAPDREFLLDGQPHRVRLGAPTRELYLDGQFYECFFGGPPIFTDLGGVKRTIKLEGPPPSVNIGTTKRQDLVAGRIAIIVDNTYSVPIYLDAKPQRIDVGNTALILRFIDGLMRAMINDQPFKVNYNGPPQAIIVRGNKHYLGFSALPSNIRPGYAVISQMMGVVLTEDTTTETLPPLPAPPIPPNFTGFDVPPQKPIEDISNPSGQSYSSTYSLVPTTTVPFIPIVLPKLEPVTSSYVPPPIPASTVPPILPSNMDINELFKKLVDSGIVPKDKPKEIVLPKTKKKEKEADDLTIKPVDFSDPSSLKQKQPGLIHNLYTGIQCSSCGIRFTAEFTIKYSSHLDWHFRQNRREKMASKTVQSRKWYYDTSDWCKYEEQEDESTRAASWFDLQAEQGSKNDEQVEEENVPCISARKDNVLAACYLCHDQFEQFYHEKDEEWQLRNCIEKDKRLYHPMCYDDMIKTREEKIRKRNDAIEEAKRLESLKIVFKKEPQMEVKSLENIVSKDEVNEKLKEVINKLKEDKEVKINEEAELKDEVKLREKEEIKEEVELEKKVELKKEVELNEIVEIKEEVKLMEEVTEVEFKKTVKETLIEEKESKNKQEIPIEKRKIEELIIDENLPVPESVSCELQVEENIKKNVHEDLEIPDTMEIIQFTEVLSPKMIENSAVKDSISLSTSNIQDSVLNELKPRSPSPISTMTCSIDGNTDTEWNVPVAPAIGTIKINISQKISPVVKPTTPAEELSLEPQSPQDFTPTFGKIDPDQPPPPGLEMEAVVVPKVQKKMKPRLMNNVKKMREYPTVNKGKEMSGLCSIM